MAQIPLAIATGNVIARPMEPTERFVRRFTKIFGADPRLLEPSADGYDFLMVCCGCQMDFDHV